MRPNLARALVLSAALFAAPVLAVDGDLDSRYGDGGVAREPTEGSAALNGLACAPDGTCYAAMTTPGFDFQVREISPAGSFLTDLTASFELFGPDNTRAAGVGADGRPVVVGSAWDASEPRFAIARFRHVSQLVLDTTFSGDGKVMQDFVGPAHAAAVAIGPSGEIVVAGSYYTLGSAGWDFAVMRFLSDGTPDPNFDGNGVRTIDFNHGTAADDDYVEAVAVLPDGRIVVVGRAQYGTTDYDFAVARFLTTGALDPSFSGDGKQTVYFDQGTSDNDVATAVAIDRFGRIVIAGYAETDNGYIPALARLQSNGTPDPSFGNTLPNPDGKFLGIEGMLAITRSVAVLPFPSEQILYMNESGLLFGLTGAGQFDLSWGGGDAALLIADPAAFGTEPKRMTTFGGMPVIAGQSVVEGVDNYFVLRLSMSQIFGDDFESGDTKAWSGW